MEHRAHDSCTTWLTAACACSLAVVTGCATAPVATETAQPVAAAPAAAAAPKPSVLPRVMLLIDEKNLGTIATAEVETLAAGMLMAEKCPVVDQDMVRSNIKKDQQLLKMAGDNRGAAAVGLQYGADVIIVGEAVAKPSARRIAESNLRTYQAVVTLRAVRTDNSEMIASASETASVIGLEDVVGGSQALKTAGRKTLEALLPATTVAWKPGPAAGAGATVPLTLTIGGVDQMWKLKAVRETLRDKVNGVSGVVQRSYSAGAVVFDVQSAVPAEELAEAIVLGAPDGLKYQVLNIGPGKIELRAVGTGG